MNIYLAIILGTLAGEYLIQSVARILNLRSMRPELPEEFHGFYDEEKYLRSQSYGRAHAQLGVVSSTFSLVVVVGFILAGGFNTVDLWARSLAYGSVTTGLIFFGILGLLSQVLGLPFSLYRTFVVEERFGFNKMTWRLYLSDMVKSLLLGSVLGGLILGGILYFFEFAGERAWLYAWMVVSVFILVMPPIFTTYIAPLFNRFEPLPEGELKTALRAYAKQVDFPLTGVFIMDGSKRSGHSNAYFSGFGKNKRISLFDTLVEQHSVDELVAILAHEIGHYKKKHILLGTLVAILQFGILFWLLSFFIAEPALFEAFGVAEPSAHAGLVFFSLLYSPITFVLGLAQHAWSRKNEFEADAFAATTLGSAKNLVLGLKRLSVANLGNLTPHALTVFINYTHPPILARIDRLRRVVL